MTAQDDPVQIAGVVPETDDACWGDEHALTNAAKNAKRDVAATAT